MFKIFSTNNCPKCKQLKKELERQEIKFSEVNMGDIDSQAELYAAGIFVLSAPVLQVNEKFYTVTDLFNGEDLRDLLIF